PLRALTSAEVLEPGTEQAVEDEILDARLTVTSQWQLIRRRFLRHRVAVVSLVVLAVFYTVALFADMVAPQDPFGVNARYPLVHATGMTFVDPDGEFTFWPGANPLVATRDPITLRITYVPDTRVWYPIELVGHGPPYKLWGIIPMDLHFFRMGGDP